MKLHRPKLSFLLVLSFYSTVLFPQTIEEQMSKSHANCQTMFMNAMDVLPKLYREKAFDSLDRAIDIWENSCSGMPEVTITRILLKLETETFTTSQDIDGATIELLISYAKAFPSPDALQNFSSDKGPKNSFYRFSSVWAKLLLENKQLDQNEAFICRVVKGEIRDPQKEIQRNSQVYPEFAALIGKNFEAKRKQTRLDFAVSTGVWIPTNNLSTLGVHPSFGFHFGLRNSRHQLDATLQMRYLNSANAYAVKRDGYLDSTFYYFGGYIGLDYNYYLISKKRFDLGVLAGMGWDGFDFAPQPYDYHYDYYPYYNSHVTISSFNANAGLRFNYYFTHSFYVGLQGRYNVIEYNTHGGSDLSGDAFSVDLIFGFH